jgi:hypothetical protein
VNQHMLLHVTALCGKEVKAAVFGV